MDNFLLTNYAIMDFEWMYQHIALTTLYELSLVTYDNQQLNLTIRPNVDLRRRRDYKKRLVSLHIDSARESVIFNSTLNFKAAFNQVARFVENSDLTVVYVYGASDIALLKSYMAYLHKEERLDRVFVNRDGQHVPIIDIEQRMFSKGFSLSVVNMHNIVYDDITQHTFSSIDDCIHLKRVVDFILENQLNKKSFVKLLNEKLIPLVKRENIPLDMDLLKVLYRSYNSSIPKEKFR